MKKKVGETGKKRKWAVLFIFPLLGLLQHPLWYFESVVAISLLSFAVGCILQPLLSLCVVGAFFYAEKQTFRVTVGLTLFSNITTVLVHYLNWGISSNGLFAPDGMTVYIMVFELAVALTISAMGFLFIYIKRHWRKDADAAMRNKGV